MSAEIPRFLLTLSLICSCLDSVKYKLTSVFVDANNETLSNYTRFINHDGENFNLIAETVPLQPDPSITSSSVCSSLISSGGSTKRAEKKLLKRMSRNEIFNRYRVGFYCTRDVFEGEELTFDYGANFKADWN